MKIQRFNNLKRAITSLKSLSQKAIAQEDTFCVYVGDRLVFASYEQGRTQVFDLKRREDKARKDALCSELFRFQSV